MPRGVILTPNAARRTRDAVRDYERRPRDMTRGRKRGEEGGGDFFLCKAKVSDGANGTANSTPTYRYTVYALDGTTIIAENVTVISRRTVGAVLAHTVTPDYAQAVYANGQIYLWDAGERPETHACTT